MVSLPGMTRSSLWLVLLCSPLAIACGGGAVASVPDIEPVYAPMPEKNDLDDEEIEEDEEDEEPAAAAKPADGADDEDKDDEEDGEDEDAKPTSKPDEIGRASCRERV